MTPQKQFLIEQFLIEQFLIEQFLILFLFGILLHHGFNLARLFGAIGLRAFMASVAVLMQPVGIPCYMGTGCLSTAPLAPRVVSDVSMTVGDARALRDKVVGKHTYDFGNGIGHHVRDESESLIKQFIDQFTTRVPNDEVVCGSNGIARKLQDPIVEDMVSVAFTAKSWTEESDEDHLLDVAFKSWRIQTFLATTPRADSPHVVDNQYDDILYAANADVPNLLDNHSEEFHYAANAKSPNAVENQFDVGDSAAKADFPNTVVDQASSTLYKRDILDFAFAAWRCQAMYQSSPPSLCFPAELSPLQTLPDIPPFPQLIVPRAKQERPPIKLVNAECEQFYIGEEVDTDDEVDTVPVEEPLELDDHDFVDSIWTDPLDCEPIARYWCCFEEIHDDEFSLFGHEDLEPLKVKVSALRVKSDRRFAADSRCELDPEFLDWLSTPVQRRPSVRRSKRRCAAAPMASMAIMSNAVHAFEKTEFVSFRALVKESLHTFVNPHNAFKLASSGHGPLPMLFRSIGKSFGPCPRSVNEWKVFAVAMSSLEHW